MDETQLEKYNKLMKVVRSRLDSIKSISNNNFADFNDTEIAAFHGRKIIEAIVNVDIDIVWVTVADELPALLAQLRGLSVAD